jgi:hypothetical protein
MESLLRLEERVERLERTNRLYRRIAGIVAVCFVVVVAAGAKLVTEGRLYVQDSAGTARVIAEVHRDRAIVNTFSRDGDRQVFLGENSGGMPMVAVLDRRGTDRIRLGFDDGGTPFLGFFDVDGKLVKRVDGRKKKPRVQAED